MLTTLCREKKEKIFVCATDPRWQSIHFGTLPFSGLLQHRLGLTGTSEEWLLRRFQNEALAGTAHVLPDGPRIASLLSETGVVANPSLTLQLSNLQLLSCEWEAAFLLRCLVSHHFGIREER